jgi:hypothetical protein
MKINYYWDERYPTLSVYPEGDEMFIEKKDSLDAPDELVKRFVAAQKEFSDAEEALGNYLDYIKEEELNYGR